MFKDLTSEIDDNIRRDDFGLDVFYKYFTPNGVQKTNIKGVK
jgi:hypothetical protein